MFLNLLNPPFTSTTVKAFYSSSILLPLAHLPLILLHCGSPFLLFSSDNMVKRIRERAQPLDGNGMSVFPEEGGEEEGRERCEHAESAASCANIPTLHRSQNSRTQARSGGCFLLPSLRLSQFSPFIFHSFSYRIFPMRGAVCLLAMPLGYDHYKRAAARPQPRLRLIVVIVRNVGGSRRSWVCHRTLTRHTYLHACMKYTMMS